MPLPTIGDKMSNPSSNLQNAIAHYAPITGGNQVHQAMHGNAQWLGTTLQISSNGTINYRFIPAVQSKVSYCIVPGAGTGDVYVISDQYGGCEYHELYNATLNALAFLHVYRGGGNATTYTLNAGWQLRSRKRSSVIAQTYGMNGSNWSVSYINRSRSTPTVQSTFIHINNSLIITGVDTGDTPYPSTCTIL